MTGRRLLHFAVLEKLGEGGMGAEGKMQTRIVGTTVPALEGLKVWLIQEGTSVEASPSPRGAVVLP